MYKTESNLLNFYKVRKRKSWTENYKCFCCENEIKRGCYALGKGVYTQKYCLSCAEEILNHFIHSLEVYVNRAKYIKGDIQTNMKKYKENNLLNSLAN